MDEFILDRKHKPSVWKGDPRDADAPIAELKKNLDVVLTLLACSITSSKLGFPLPDFSTISTIQATVE